MSMTVVYVARIPHIDSFEPLYPPERQAEIDRVSSEKVKMEKYFVWKLLEYAILKTLGEPIENIRFEKRADRKWVSDRIFFSLSHTDSVVAVALSDREVGVDVERIRPHRQGLERQILTARELEELRSIGEADLWEYIIGCWTQKESIFKASDKALFEPIKIETSEYSLKTERLELDDESFMLSVCAHDAHAVLFEICEL